MTLLSTQDARRLYDQAAALARIGAWECDLKTERLSWTDGVYDLFGLPRGASLHRRSTVEQYHDGSRAEMERLRAAMICAGGGFVLDARITTADGTERWMRLSAAVAHAQGRPVRVYGAKQDVTHEKELWQGLRRLAYSDPLTGLANRRGFDGMFDEMLRDEDGIAVSALAIVDLDQFKRINDELGHAAGDACLREIALRLQATLGDAVMIARIGGDEFAILLRSALGRRHLTHSLAVTLDTLSRPVIWKDRPIDIGASIGATILRATPGRDPARFFAEADSALYVAKAAGRGRLRIFGEPVEDRPTPEIVPSLRRAG